MSGAFQDHFSAKADAYARYRPDYPAALFAWLRSLVSERRRAWDCATGNGQAALALAEHFDEVIATEMATISAPFHEVIAWLLEHVELRPGFAELVATHDPVVVSGGFVELIEPILEREGIVAPVIANTVTADPGGWRATFRDSPICTVCGERCKRGVIASSRPFTYVGDGVSDRCVSLAATRLFARDGLAVWLDAQGVRYETFADLDDVRRALDRC